MLVCVSLSVVLQADQARWSALVIRSYLWCTRSADGVAPQSRELLDGRSTYPWRSRHCHNAAWTTQGRSMQSAVLVRLNVMYWLLIATSTTSYITYYRLAAANQPSVRGKHSNDSLSVVRTYIKYTALLSMTERSIEVREGCKRVIACSWRPPVVKLTNSI